MKPFSRLTRLAAAGALVVSAAAVWSATPVGATSATLTQSCQGPANQFASVGNSETITVTVTAGDCQQVLFLPNLGSAGTATLNGSPLSSTPLAVSTNDVIVITAPASGTGSGVLRFFDQNAANPAVQWSYGLPPIAGSLSAPGDGSLVVTYSGTVNMLQGVVVFFAAPGSACNGTNPPTELQPMDNPPDNFQYLLDSSQFGSDPTLGASPSVISAGTLAQTNVGPQGVPIAAGTYQACLFSYGMATPLTLLQGIEVTLGAVTPTTTTPSTPVTPTITG